MSDILNHSPCLTNCQSTFGNMIVPGDGDFDRVCQVLSDQSRDNIFSWLYCCDLNCGIQFGSSPRLDPNVNEVVKRCKGFGISDLVDPGPPQASQCQTILALTVFPTTPVFSSTTASIQSSMSSSVSTSPFKQSISNTPTNATTYQLLPSQNSALLSESTIAASTTSYIFTNTSPMPSQSLNSSSSSVSPLQSTNPPTLWQKLSSAAKAGSIIGLTLLVLFILLTIRFLVRKTRRTQIRTTQFPEIDSHQQSAEEVQSTRSSSKRSCVPKPIRPYDVVVIETEGKNSVDSAGLRWPETVVLTGDAKETWDWSVAYGKEFRERTSLDKERRENMFEYQMERNKF